MDREGAETYLRLLAEAAMRGSLTPAAWAPRAEREHDYGGGARPDRRGSPRPGHRRGDPDRLQAGYDRAAAAPPIRGAGGDGGRVAHPGPGRPAPEAGPGPVTRGSGALGGPRPRAGRP